MCEKETIDVAIDAKYASNDTGWCAESTIGIVTLKFVGTAI